MCSLLVFKCDIYFSKEKVVGCSGKFNAVCMDVILKYFPDLSDKQIHQFERLQPLYEEWNEQINVISRKDIQHLYVRHILHSLSIAKWINWVDGTKILDVGCGGGFPGIPLAIYFPNVNFHLIDSINKKLKVVSAVSDSIGLTNIRTSHIRAENVAGKVDYVVTRAVAKMPKLLSWSRKSVSSKEKNAIPNGLIALKGGDLSEEIKPVKRNDYVEQIAIADFFEEDFFEEKFIVYVQA